MTGTTNGPVCGNCGEGVAPDAITCPHCGVLLAAYQAAGGSETLTIVIPDSPDTSVPESSLPPSSPTPTDAMPAAQDPYHPASISPIGDALQRTRAETRTELYGEPGVLDTESDDLAAMASGDDDLAAMADGNDDLASMAAGDDELAAMAGAGSSGSFEDAVNAELAGAKVVFDGGTPIIEAAEVEVIDPAEGDAEVIEQPATAPSATSPTTTTPASARPQRPSPAERGRSQASRMATPPVEVVDASSSRQQTRSAGTNPSRVSAAPSWRSIPGGNQYGKPRDKSNPQLERMVGPLMAIPFLIIVCVILGAGRGVGGFLLVSSITTVIILFLVVRATRIALRKTSSMPRDDSWSRRG